MKIYYKVQNDLNILDEDAEQQLIKSMHPDEQANLTSDVANPEDERSKEFNNLPVKEMEPIPEFEGEIPQKENMLASTTNPTQVKNELKTSNFLATFGKTMGSDYSMEYNSIQFKRIHEKLEDYTMKYNLYKGILYDVVDIFDNKEYNLDRLKPLDFSDLKAMLKNFNKNNVFKQLSREKII